MIARRLLLLSVLAVLSSSLAGCLDGAGDAGSVDAAGAASPVPLTGFRYACPPGVEDAAAAVCEGRIASVTESLQEPYLAVDPARPGVMAIGVNAGHTVRATDGTPVAPVLLDIHVTEDHGATWRRVEIPRITHASGLPVALGSGDPALAFGADGVLHVSGMAIPASATEDTLIFHTASPDLGASWSAPTIVGRATDADRNWIGVSADGLVVVPWQQYQEDRTHVAWSTDGGATWQDAVEDECATVSPPVETEAGWLVACAGTANGRPVGAHVLRLDPARGELVRVGEVPEADDWWPALARAADGSLAGAFEKEGTVFLARSTDGGASWSGLVDVRDLVTVDDAWRYAEKQWFTTDPWGGVHLVLAGEESPLPDAYRLTPARVTFAHVAFDAVTFTPLVETLLPTGKEATDAAASPSVAPTYGNHYQGLAFDADAGHLVWTRYGTPVDAVGARPPGASLAFTVVEPVHGP